jgi:UDP-N-acetylglucosamine transferase subunit ALG13
MANTIFDELPRCRSADELKELIKKYGTNTINQHGQTILHKILSDSTPISGDECLNAITMICKINPALVNISDNKSRTPLHYICNQCSKLRGEELIVAMKTLIQYGADVNAVTKYCNTPLHLLCFECSHELNEYFEQAIKILLENGANASIKSINGNTAEDLLDVRKCELTNYQIPQEKARKMNDVKINVKRMLRLYTNRPKG